MATLKVDADTVTEGDFIPGLDNAYVVEVEQDDVSLQVGGGYGVMSGLIVDVVVITYHDRDGEECYLILPPKSLLTIERN